MSLAFTKLVDAVAHHAGGKVVEHGLDLLAALLGIEEESTKLLVDIRRDVRLLIEGPFEAGKKRLGLAKKPHRRSLARKKLIQQALDNFIDAQARESDSLKLSVICLYAAMCSLLLNEEVDAHEWMVDAYRYALESSLNILEIANNHSGPTEDQTKNDVMGFVVGFLPVITLGMAPRIWNRASAATHQNVLSHAKSQLEEICVHVTVLGNIRGAMGERRTTIPKLEVFAKRIAKSRIDRLYLKESIGRRSRTWNMLKPTMRSNVAGGGYDPPPVDVA